MSLTSAEEILDKYIDAIGGKAVLESINSKISETTTVIPGKKTEVKTTTFMKRPDKTYAISEFKVLGKSVKSEGGANGDVVWQITPGALGSKKRILSGKEKEIRLADLAFDTAAVAWQDYYKSLRLDGEEEIEGNPCYKVLFVSKNDEEEDTVCYFDKESFLISKIVKETYISEKSTKAEIFLSDYQKAADVLLPHTLKRYAEGMDDIVITINNVQANVDIPDSKFELPEKIKKLM